MCVCVCERERESVCERERESVCERERERVSDSPSRKQPILYMVGILMTKANMSSMKVLSAL